MSIAIYGHPFSSYTQKVLIALYANAQAFDFRCLGEDHPEHGAEWARRWPLMQFPLLVDGERQVVEASVILEYLHLTYPGELALLPADPVAALEVRFLDRFFDLHVMEAMQRAVAGAITGDPTLREHGMAQAVEKLGRAYAWLDGHLAGRTWAAGDHPTLADCAAAPSLFYADWTVPIPAACANVRAYRARLLAWPPFARAVDGGRPYRPVFPLGAPDRD